MLFRGYKTMITFLKNLFNRFNMSFNHKQRQVEENFNDIKKQISLLQTELTSKTKELEELKAKQQAYDDKKNSKDPWVILSSAEYDKESGFKIELDWNAAFIKQLKENGIDGPTEEAIIQKWLAFLYEDIVARLDEKQQVEKEEKQMISDYQ